MVTKQGESKKVQTSRWAARAGPPQLVKIHMGSFLWVQGRVGEFYPPGKDGLARERLCGQVLRSLVYPLACKDLLQSRARNHPYRCLAILKVCWEPGLWMNHLLFPINILKPTWVKCSYLVFRLGCLDRSGEHKKAELKINDLDSFSERKWEINSLR